MEADRTLIQEHKDNGARYRPSPAQKSPPQLTAMGKVITEVNPIPSSTGWRGFLGLPAVAHDALSTHVPGKYRRTTIGKMEAPGLDFILFSGETRYLVIFATSHIIAASNSGYSQLYKNRIDFGCRGIKSWCLYNKSVQEFGGKYYFN